MLPCRRDSFWVNDLISTGVEWEASEGNRLMAMPDYVLKSTNGAHDNDVAVPVVN